MNHYVITGSIGHISKPVIEGLVKAGKKVSVITSNSDKIKEIEALGARALVGSLQDADFVKTSFQDADVVYTMIPPIWQTNNWRASQNEVADNYINALKNSDVKYVVNLSAMGAHRNNSVGPVNALGDFETKLAGLSSLHVKNLRPAFFYYNLLNQIGLIKQAGIMGANYGGGDNTIDLVHTADIAAVALEELLSLNFKGSSARYIVSDQRTGAEISRVVSKAIGKEIPWVEFTDEQQRDGLLQAAVPETHALAFTEMGKSIREGVMQENRRKVNPPLSKTKLEDFVKEFVVAYGAK